MKITLLAVGKTATARIDEGVRDYMARASRYMPVEMATVADVKASTAEQQKQREGAALLKTFKPTDHVMLLDERGDMPTSRKFAETIQRVANSGTKRLVLVIGGPYGFAQEVYDRADGMIALSRMTFTHEMVRLFIAEQIYRAMTIIRGEPYHHD